MPGAADYRTAAGQFRTVAESLAREAAARRLSTADGFGLHGPAAAEVDDRQRLASEQLAVASTRYDDLAGECLRRADVCADYSRRLARYWSLPTLERAVAPFPSRPAPWAEA